MSSRHRGDLYTHAWDKEQKLLGSVVSRVQNSPTMTLHRAPQDYRLLVTVALCLTSASASASQLSPPPSHPAQSLQLLPRSSCAFQTGYLGPSLAWSLFSEARKHFLPLEGHRGNQQTKSRDSRPAHLHNPHSSLLFWSPALTL